MSIYKEWFDKFNESENYKKLTKNPVAYFCMEYAMPKNIPIYAGGLGVLAGDYVQEALSQKFPMVAIGLFYSKKFIPENNGDEYITNSPYILGLEQVMGKNDKPLTLNVPIGDKKVSAVVWLYKDGTIPTYLLDTNVEENDSSERTIVDLLYVSDKAVRIKQEILLGIGGVKLLEALEIEPSIYHMNEGHSSLLVYELTRVLMKKKKLEFNEAFEEAKKKIVFTNHTLVAGAQDAFDKNLVALMLEAYVKDYGAKKEELVAKGIDIAKPQNFSMTQLSFEAASRANAVSKLHASAAKGIWPDREMKPITNGVNIKRWDWVATEKVDEDKDIAARHKVNKSELLDLVRREADIHWHENDLVVGWARRLAGYKRPTAFFDDLEKTKTLFNNPGRPLRLVFAGIPHYSDGEGRAFLNRLRYLARGELKGSIVYINNYSTQIANLMVAGSDIWLNTPTVGMEACGTSGMKAALNGTLLCSTNDGWVQEIDLEKVGFILNSEAITYSLFNVFGKLIIPNYYDGLGKKESPWKEKMLSARQLIMDNFGTDRMLKDYIEQMYMPILEGKE